MAVDEDRVIPVDVQEPHATLPPSLIRTLIPMIAGAVASWLITRWGIHTQADWIVAALTAAIGYLYYAGARFLEVFVSPKWGFVLGFTKTPVYAKPPLPEAVVAAGKRRRGQAGAMSAPLALIVVGVVLIIVGLLTPLAFLWWIGVLLLIIGLVLLVLGRGRV